VVLNAVPRRHPPAPVSPASAPASGTLQHSVSPQGLCKNSWYYLYQVYTQNHYDKHDNQIDKKISIREEKKPRNTRMFQEETRITGRKKLKLFQILNFFRNLSCNCYQFSHQKNPIGATGGYRDGHIKVHVRWRSVSPPAPIICYEEFNTIHISLKIIQNPVFHSSHWSQGPFPLNCSSSAPPLLLHCFFTAPPLLLHCSTTPLPHLHLSSAAPPPLLVNCSPLLYCWPWSSRSPAQSPPLCLLTSPP